MNDVRPGDLVHVISDPKGHVRVWATASHEMCIDTVINDATGMLGLVLGLWTDQDPYNEEAYVLIDGRLGWVIHLELLKVVSR